MIKLTVNQGRHSSDHTFTTDTVSIGTADAASDVKIEEKNFTGTLVQIVREEEHYFVINSSNDPFITLNDLPFGKKQLKPFDQLQIGKTSIQIEFKATQAPNSDADEDGDIDFTSISLTDLTDAPVVDTKDRLIDILDDTLKANRKDSETGDPDTQNLTPREFSNWEQFTAEKEDWNDLDFEALVKEVESMAEVDVTATPEPMSKIPESKVSELKIQESRIPEPETPESDAAEAERIFIRKSIKDDAEPEAPPEKERAYKNEAKASFSRGESSLARLGKDWRLMALLIASAAGFTLLFLAVLYYSANGKRTGEEIRAAQGVADVSAALAYAQTYGIKPHKQNWSDPDFIRNNLNLVLSPHYTPLIHLDNHCYFKDTPYFLRIYNNNSLTQFIVIAQPVPNFLQWMIPKPSIIIDSRSMELRKLTDLRPLNRLLFASNLIDEELIKEISRVVKEGELIPLSMLRSKQNRRGFAPPNELELFRPEAVNLVYNAPRYHLFGERLLEHVKMLSRSAANMRDLEMFREEIQLLAQLPHFIIYSSEAIEAAIEAHKALKIFAPNHDFLAAYLKVNKDGSSISHLLTIENQAEHLIAFDPSNKTTQANDETAFFELKYDIKELEKSATPLQEHPFTLQLSSLLTARQQALTPVAAEIQHLMQQNQQNFVPNFSTRMSEVVKYYNDLDLELQRQVVACLEKLHTDYESLPLSQLAIYVKHSGAEALIRSFLSNRQQEHPELIVTEQEIDEALYQITLSNNLQDLVSAISHSLILLRLDRMADIDQLIARQNELQFIVMGRLEHILLSPQSLENSSNNLENETQLLKQAMRMARIEDKDIYEFYIAELEQSYKHSNSHQHPEPSKGKSKEKRGSLEDDTPSKSPVQLSTNDE